MAGGRPTDYRVEYCELIEQFLGKGNPLKGFGHQVGATTDTIYEWAKKHKEFSDAIKRGREQCLLVYIKAGKTGVWGRDKDTKQVLKVNPAIWIFMMKNMFGWKDKVEIQEDQEEKYSRRKTYVDDEAEEKEDEL